MKIPFDRHAFRWRGVAAEPYKFSLGDEAGMGWRGVTRYTIGGPPGLPSRFQLRYFELAPDGYSSLEKHTHVHFIIVLRGKGKALVDRQVLDLQPLDVLYVPPNTPHRWINEGDETFGFLCPVDAERDPPKPVNEEEWQSLQGDPATAPYVF